jgi:Uma2 family endonuclease
MSTDVETRPDVILYPDSDGQPMAENTLQFQWIVTLQGNLDLMFRNDPRVFVAGDLLWYAEEGTPAERAAPDAMVVFGRPKGYRGSYMQWREEGVAPQVVFEVLSPGNRLEEMNRKFDFYEKHGVEEYYVYDPEDVQLTAWMRMDGRLRAVFPLRNHTSPRLRIRFDLSGEEMVVYGPDEKPFLTFLELGSEKELAEREAAESAARAVQFQREAAESAGRAEQSRREAAESAARAEQSQREAAEFAAREAQAQREAASSRERAERLAARLREMGVDPDSLTPPDA